MRTLVWSASFARALRKLGKRRPELKDKAKLTLTRLTTDPFHAALRTHRLKGDLSGVWACSVEHDIRIVFEFVTDPESAEDVILLIDLETREEVY